MTAALTIGASEAAAVAGLDPYMDPTTLGLRKLGRIPEAPQSEAAALGLLLEQAHGEALVRDGWTVVPAPADGFVSAEHGWMIAHPDALTAVEGAAATVELKARGIAPDERLRARDTLQAMHQLAVTGYDAGLVSELHGGYGGMRRVEWIVQRDERLIGRMIELDESFLALLARGEVPAPNGSKSAGNGIRAAYPAHVPGMRVRETREQADWRKQIAGLDEQLAAVKRHRDRLAQRYQAWMGDAEEALSLHDETVATFRAHSRASLDAKALRAAHPLIAQEFTRTTTVRRMTWA